MLDGFKMYFGIPHLNIISLTCLPEIPTRPVGPITPSLPFERNLKKMCNKLSFLFIQESNISILSYRIYLSLFRRQNSLQVLVLIRLRVLG